MDDSISKHGSPRTSDDYQRLIDEYIVRIDGLLEQMAEDRAEIERLAAISRARGSETDRVIAETIAILDRLAAG